MGSPSTQLTITGTPTFILDLQCFVADGSGQKKHNGHCDIDDGGGLFMWSGLHCVLSIGSKR